ncbi:unnamed protein product [marine sediment metagenome]|uniref:Uncharacterized protein n=1 Tax=marine sediment metagenome TaxID=412755 RepID=X0UH88_9ZZZZ
MEAGDVGTYTEDNVRIRVEVLAVEEDEIRFSFLLRALEKSRPHMITMGIIDEGEEFEVSARKDHINSPYKGWSFDEEWSK